MSAWVGRTGAAIAAMASIGAGCAANSGVVPIGPDTYMISRQGSAFAGMGTLKAKAFKEASAFCEARSHVMQVVRTDDAQPPYVLGNYPRTEIQFMCLDPSDPEVGRPKLQRDPLIIERRE